MAKEQYAKKDVDKLVVGVSKNLEKVDAALAVVRELLDTELEIVETEE